jgi:polar amino acid transport system substrate-binding protein
MAEEGGHLIGFSGRRWKIVPVVAALLVTAAGCGGGGENTGGAKGGGNTGEAGRTVRVAITPTMPYIGLTGAKLTGLDGELFLKAADKLGVKVQVTTVDFPALLAGVQAHRFDVGIGNISWRNERAKVGLFTDPPYYSPTVLAERPGLNVNAVDGLAGRKLGTVQNFVYIPALKKVPHSSLQTYPTYQACLEDLNLGRIDIAFLDALTVVFTKTKATQLKYDAVALTPPTDAQIKAQPEYDVFMPTMSGWYLSKSERALTDQLTQVIRGFYQDGTASQVIKKWGGDPANMLKPLPAFTTQRTAVDRPGTWTPPSAGS